MIAMKNTPCGVRVAAIGGNNLHILCSPYTIHQTVYFSRQLQTILKECNNQSSTPLHFHVFWLCEIFSCCYSCSLLEHLRYALLACVAPDGTEVLEDNYIQIGEDWYRCMGGRNYLPGNPDCCHCQK